MSHHGHTGASTATLVTVALINGLFGVVQIVVGIAAGSVAVLADAGHQAVDMIGLLIALGSMRLLARPADKVMTYGWSKIDALGSYTSCLILSASLVWITYESVERLIIPSEVAPWPVIWMGVGGIVVNAAGAILLGHASGLAVNAARLHLLTDLAGSALVLLTGIGVAANLPSWIDPVVSLIIVGIVVHTTIGLIRASTNQLLDRSPGNTTVDELAETLTSHAGVKDVHHLHIRALGAGSLSSSAHVIVEGDTTLHDTQVLGDELRQLVVDDLGIDHVTFQFECHPCEHSTHA